MFGVDLQVGDKIMFVGNEQTEYFTFGRIYEVKSLDKLRIWGNEIHIMLMDDSEEENYISIPFYKRNFSKVSVTITVYDDNTFTTETELGTLNWNDDVYTLDLLVNLLVNLGIGYNIVDLSTEID